MRKPILLEDVKKSKQDFSSVVPIIVLQVMRAINGVIFGVRQLTQLASVENYIRPADRINIQQSLLPSNIARRQRNILIISTDV